MNLVKKISAKDVLGNVIEFAKAVEIGKTVTAYSVVGIVDSYVQGVGTYGEWTRFQGDIQAIVDSTGEVYRGSAVHMPEVLESVLISSLSKISDSNVKTNKRGERTYALPNEVEFAYVVTLTRVEDDDKGGIQYKWGVSPKTKVVENDKLSRLLSLLEGPAVEVKKAK